MEKFTTLTTKAVPLNIANVDTDQIIPARFLKATDKKGFGDNVFRDWRFDKSGNLIGMTTSEIKGGNNLKFAVDAAEYWK